MPDRDRMDDARDARTGRAAPLSPPSRGPLAAPVWVLEDDASDAALPAIGIAERLALPFRRISLTWNWRAPLLTMLPYGSLTGVAKAARTGAIMASGSPSTPALVLSAGARAATVGLWLKQRFHCRLVHCLSPEATWLYGGGRRKHFDLLVTARDPSERAPDNILPVVGPVHRVGPDTLRQAAMQWAERLEHLSHPRLLLVVGGGSRMAAMEPARAYALGQTAARLAGAAGGSVLAVAGRHVGQEAADALAASIGDVMHLVYRWDEPGENPYLGFLTMADAIIVTADAPLRIAEACATAAAVYVAYPELAGACDKRLIKQLIRSGQVRPLRHELSLWPRTPLDEAGRVAETIRKRFALGG